MTDGTNPISSNSTNYRSPVQATNQSGQLTQDELDSLRGTQLASKIDELIRTNDQKKLVDLAMRNTEARGILSDLASNQGNQQTSQIANDVLKAAQQNQNAKNGNGVNQRAIA